MACGMDGGVVLGLSELSGRAFIHTCIGDMIFWLVALEKGVFLIHHCIQVITEMPVTGEKKRGGKAGVG